MDDLGWILLIVASAVTLLLGSMALGLAEQKTDFHLCMVISKDNYSQCKPLLKLPKYAKIGETE